MNYIVRRDFVKYLSVVIMSGTSAIPVTSLAKRTLQAPSTPTNMNKVRSSIKLSDRLPKSYVVDGSADYTMIVQEVLDQLRDEGGGTIELPENATILIGNLIIYSNTTITGNPDSSVLKVKPGCNGIIVNPGGGQDRRPAEDVRNVKLSKFKIIGQVESAGFSEHIHLLNLSGISDSEVEYLKIVGFQGDGIYLGSARLGAAALHNTNVRISNVTIDGINKKNRNGISIIDGVKIFIDKVKITRCSRSDMPGAIDIEPNADPLLRIDDIRISNIIISDVGGNVGAVSVVLQGATYATPPGPIRIDGVSIDGCSSNAFAILSKKPSKAPPGPLSVDIALTNCIARNGGRPFTLIGVSNVSLIENKFYDFKGTALIGYLPRESKCEKIVLSGNLWRNCGYKSGTGLAIFSVAGLKITDDFVDCGTGIAGNANAIEFKLGFSESVDISKSKFSSPNGKMLVAIKKDIGHFFKPKTNRFEGNQLDKLGNDFEVK